MSKKAKSEVTDNSADTVMDGVLSENQAKLNKLNSSIQAAYERRRKIITDSKLYTYDKLSQLYGGAEGQALLDAVTAEHTELVELVRELSGVNIPHTEVVNHINHCKHPFGNLLACCTCLTMFPLKLLYRYCPKSQGMKQLMAGGGVALIGITLVPLLSGLFG